MGLDVIAIVKKGNARYRWDGKMVSVKDIYEQDRKRRGRSRYLLSYDRMGIHRIDALYAVGIPESCRDR